MEAVTPVSHVNISELPIGSFCRCCQSSDTSPDAAAEAMPAMERFCAQMTYLRLVYVRDEP